MMKLLLWWLGAVVHGVGIVTAGDAHPLTRGLLLVSLALWAFTGVVMAVVAGARLVAPGVKAGLLKTRGGGRHENEEGQEVGG